MGKRIDLTNKRLGKLTAIKPIGRDKKGNAIWLCLCNCGNFHAARSHKLRWGNVRSCGCLNPKNPHKPKNWSEILNW